MLSCIYVCLLVSFPYLLGFIFDLNFIVKDLLLLLLSSSSPLYGVFILKILRQTISLGNTVLHLFCYYYSWCLYRFSVEYIVFLQ